MVRLLILLLILHALLHLIGFVYGFRLLPAGQFTTKAITPLPEVTLRITYVFWLITTVLFLTAAVTLVLQKDWWWMPAIIAVVLSQILIVLYWPDAKWGTVANVLIVLALLPAWGDWRFHAMVQEDVKAVLADVPPAAAVVTEADLAPLPQPVQKWLRRSGVVGKPINRTVHLYQSGQMRTSNTGKWMPVTAEQYISATQPGFVWVADVKAAPGLHLAGRDLYHEGRGHMLIKALSLYPVADNRGATIDQGTLLRYLAEISWNPSAALEPYITWEAVDDHRAMATMHYGDVTASGVFGFTPEGDAESFEALRFYERKGGATLEPWVTRTEPGAYKEFHGVRIPVRTTVTWKLREGDLTWFKMEVVDMDYE